VISSTLRDVTQPSGRSGPHLWSLRRWWRADGSGSRPTRACTTKWDLSACGDRKGAFPCQARTSQIGLHALPDMGQGRASIDRPPIPVDVSRSGTAWSPPLRATSLNRSWEPFIRRSGGGGTVDLAYTCGPCVADGELTDQARGRCALIPWAGTWALATIARAPSGVGAEPRRNGSSADPDVVPGRCIARPPPWAQAGAVSWASATRPDPL